MKRALIVLTNLLLALFLLAALGSAALDVLLLRPGDREVKLVRGTDKTLTNMPVAGAALYCPLGSLAVVQRVAAEQAHSGDALVCFGDDGRVYVGVFRGMQDGMAVLDVNGAQMLAEPRQVAARYVWALPGAYDIWVWACTPWFIAAAGGTVFVLFVLARIDWRSPARTLTPSDEEISSMFR